MWKNKTLDAVVDEDQWRLRREKLQQTEKPSDSRLLSDFARRVGPTYQGAVRRPL